MKFLILLGIISFILEKEIIASRQETDSVIVSNEQKSHLKSDNFYKTDSIFSLRSPKGYFPSLIHNIGEQAVAPLHFSGRQWLYTGCAAGITTALIFADEDIDAVAKVQKQNHPWINKSSPFITKFGSNNGIFSVVAYGLICAGFKNEKGVQTSLLATQAMITSGIWAQVIKRLTGRERPEAAYVLSGIPGGRWHGLFSKYHQLSTDDRPAYTYDAFPSGHTATAFSIATVFASQYNEHEIVPVLFYSGATLVGLSRLTEHEHWASDVFVGALLGYLSGKQVVNHYNKLHQAQFQQNNKLKPVVSFIQEGNQMGFLVRW